MKTMCAKIGDSQFLPKLALYYALAPSAVLIRTAEAELLSSISLEPPVLDLACGDGFFASLICPSGMEAGCDFSKDALRQAEARKQYRNLVWADITKKIPFPDANFQTIVSNSSLEHVIDIDTILQEVARILKPGGKFIFTLGSNYAYEWWPLSEKAKRRYLNFQPVYNYFSLKEWQKRLAAVGLEVVGHQYYLDKAATQRLMWFDYYFSKASLTRDWMLVRPLIRALRFIPRELLAKLWMRMFGNFPICVNDAGGGILIIARKG
jgi:SAM-dependent methyltransferase